MGVFGRKLEPSRNHCYIEIKTGRHLVEAFVDKLNSMGLSITKVYDYQEGEIAFNYRASITEEYEVKTYMKKIEEFLNYGKEAT